MASIPQTFLLFSLILISLSPIIFSSIIEDLNNLKPPPDFNATLTNNCIKNPSLKYCNSTSTDLPDIFKSTIVSNHLCNESKNPNCPDLFTKIDLRNRPKTAPLYLSFTFFWKYCPLTIISIDLSNNSITGSFPSDILHCSQIQSLDLSYNDFVGDVPLESFSPLINLTFLNLSYNRFSESKISDTHFFQRFNSSSFVHSGLIPNYQKFKVKAVILLMGLPIFILLMVGFLGFICLCRPDYLPSFLQRQHKFTLAMLNVATKGFSRENLVGKIGDLEIYRGVLRDGTEVRIEIYREKISSEDYKKFAEECRILVMLDHKNLVRILGWCDQRRLRAIVIEWVEGKNIDMWLSQSPAWNQRLKVLMGVVKGMCYLYEQWPEVGYDLKTSSVLLSKEDGEPLISRFRVRDQNSNSKNVYRFGVFLMEIMMNKRPHKEIKRGETGLIEWMKMHYPENVWKVIDERIKKTGITYKQATQGIGLALMCTDVSNDQQPSLDQISNILTRVYESSSLIVTPPNHKRSHRERDEEHGGIESG